MAFLASLLAGVNRLAKAVVYLCIGLIAQQIVGLLAIVPMVIAMGYLFLALRYVHIDFGPAKPKGYHAEEADKLSAEWDNLGKGS